MRVEELQRRLELALVLRVVVVRVLVRVHHDARALALVAVVVDEDAAHGLVAAEELVQDVVRDDADDLLAAREHTRLHGERARVPRAPSRAPSAGSGRSA